MKTFLWMTLALLSVQFAQATHLIGGYVQVKPVVGSPLTYEIKAVVYMYAGSAANQLTSLTMCLGNGTYTAANRVAQAYLLTDKSITVSTYRFVYTYFNPGTYAITVHLDDRTLVRNITNRNDLTLTLVTTFTTNSPFTPDSPSLNTTPVPDFPSTNFLAGVNQKVSISLKATDADGDSLVYGLARPLTRVSSGDCANQPVLSYLFPNDVTHQGTFRLNNRTGELIWDAPVQAGSYSIAVNIFEYRNSVLISNTTQEITLVVDDLPGTPSTIPPYEPAIEGTIITAINDYTDSDVHFTTFPNPVDDQLQVVIQASQPVTASIQLMDINGRELHELRFTKASRKQEQVISMDSLMPGVYLLCADVNGRSLIRKIVKK